MPDLPRVSHVPPQIPNMVIRGWYEAALRKGVTTALSPLIGTSHWGKSTSPRGTITARRGFEPGTLLARIQSLINSATKARHTNLRYTIISLINFVHHLSYGNIKMLFPLSAVENKHVHLRFLVYYLTSFNLTLFLLPPPFEWEGYHLLI